MSLSAEITLWVTRAATAIATAGAILPFIPTGAWFIRVWDFPRVQLLALSLVATAFALTLAIREVSRTESLALLSISLAAALWQLIYIIPYTPLYPTSVKTAKESNLRLLIANLDMRNNDRAAATREIDSTGADVILLIEVDEAWEAALEPLHPQFPHRVSQVRDEGLGIALWSKHPLRDTEIRHIVSDRRASIHTTIEIDDQTDVHIIGLHPTPPALSIREGEGRYDSRIRDAELVLVADMVADAMAERDSDPWIVAGDFNDVAWSKTTRLFQDLSGLSDPRVGRGLLNTYHARYAPLRYPLDHIFVSKGIATRDIHRKRIPGSDHFAVLAEFDIDPHMEPNAPNPSASAESKANGIVKEGQDDAEEHNEESNTPAKD